MRVKFYRIHGVEIEAHLSSDSLGPLLDQALSPYSAPESSSPAIVLDLGWEKKDWLVPTRARRFLHYWGLRGFALDGRVYFTDYLSHLIIEPGGRRVRGYLSEETLRENGARFLTHLIITFGLFEALRHHGLFFLHAAGLLSPQGEGYLFPANGYSGKTSLTLALVRAGFRYVSDDTVLLRSTAEGVEVLPWAKPFHVPDDLSSHYPELNHLAERPHSAPLHPKKELCPEECYPGAQAPRLLNPRWLFFPERTGAPASRLEPLRSGEALPFLLPQSLTIMFNHACAAPHLAALKRLLASARAFRLFSGTDIKADSSRLIALLESARALGGRS